MSARRTESLSSRPLRAETQYAETRDLRTAMHECDITAVELAEHCGIDEKIVRRWTAGRSADDPASKRLPTAADRARFPVALQLWYLRRDARRLEMIVAECPSVATSEVHLVLFARHAKESGELTATTAAANADGHRSDEELRNIIREGEESLEAGVALVSEARKELERRVGRKAS